MKKAHTPIVKKNIAKALLTVRTALPTFLTIVAAIASVVYFASYFGVTNRVWYMPLLAGITGLTALILPALAKSHKPLWSLVSTGITLFVLQILPDMVFFLPLIGILIFVFALLSEVMVHGPKVSWGDVIFNAFISIISALIIHHMENEIVTAIMLLISYVLILIVDFRFSFSLKTNRIEDIPITTITPDSNSDNRE